MDRDALIAQARQAAYDEDAGQFEEFPPEKSLHWLLADALASDAKLLEELKARCDREDEAVYAGGALRIPALTTDEIRALFGWDATTKDLHTQTTKGDT